jgi:hypothetical protein
MNTNRAAALPLLLTLLGACVAAPGASGPPTIGTVTTLQAERTIPDAGITMSPPSTLTAAIQANDALAVCTSKAASCPSGTATAELVIATDDSSGTADAAGKITLVMNHRLVWALSWSDVQCAHSGPAPLPGGSVGPRFSACDVTAFVDANTGAFIYTLSYAHR